jgi:hypothetical protein
MKLMQLQLFGEAGDTAPQEASQAAPQETPQAGNLAQERILRQTAEARRVYAQLDLNAEMRNPAFGRLVAAGVSVRQAFEVTHMGEILRGAIRCAVEDTRAKTVAAVQAGRYRPVENGRAGSGTAQTETDPRLLSKTQRQDVRDRVLRGESVHF